MCSPHQRRARHVGGAVAPGPDALAHAAGAQAGVQVDPGHAACARGVLRQHPAQGLVAPGGRAPAEEQAVGELVLPAGDGGLPGGHAVAGDEGLHGLAVGLVGRPGLGQQQGCTWR
jgi:hypothetical protein